MYSRNPATRLIAVEYYIRKNRFLEPHVEKWINIVLDNTGLVKTLHGCKGMRELPEEILFPIVLMKESPYIEIRKY